MEFATAMPRARLQSPAAASLSPRDVLDGLASSSHLSRDRAIISIPRLSSDALSELRAALPSRLVPDGAWDVTSAALQAASAALASPATTSDDAAAFSAVLLPLTLPLIGHTEARVRTATAKLCGDVASVLGPRVWDETSAELLGNIERNFGLDDQQRLREAERVANRDMENAGVAPRDRGLRMVHETEGWRGLETSLLAISELFIGCGVKLISRAQGDIAVADGLQMVISYIDRAKTHPNRFVREAGLRLLASIVDACVGASAGSLLESISHQLRDVVGRGLQDNWSQVRYCASVVVRKMMAGLPADVRRQFYPTFLPRMCLNRHYVAEGVRVYSQDSWKTVIAADGRVYLVKLLDDVFTFYESQSTADNHAVREAACQSFAEASTKLDPEAVKPFVPRIVHALVECFKDESWPVRDHACTALADVTAHFGEQVEATGRLNELYNLFHAHLADNIVSVRENTAASIVKASSAFPPSHVIMGMDRLSMAALELLPKIGDQ
jgi:Vacuolar 14 Fab1-binding region